MYKYEIFQNTIYSIAHKYKTRQVPLEDLVSIGNVEFARCIVEFNPDYNVRFNTFLHSRVKWACYTATKQQIQEQPIETELPTNTKTPEAQYGFHEALCQLSADAKLIVNIVFNTPQDLLNMLPTNQPRGINKYQITKYARTKGWPFPRIWAAFTEIQNIFR